MNYTSYWGLVLFGWGVAMTSCVDGEDDPVASGSNGGSTASGGTGTTTRGTVGGSTHSAGGSGGSSSTSSVGGAAGMTTAGPTGPCPPWPRERFLPWVGPFFYGPDPGPCKRVTTGATAGSYATGTFNYTYDASGKVTKITRDDAEVTTTFTWQAGLVTHVTEVNPNGSTEITYEYLADSVTCTYYTTDGTPAYIYTYEVDPQGYPLAVLTKAANPNMAAYMDNYVYEYEGCRIKRRVAYTPSGTLDSNATYDYSYDSDGHLTSGASYNMTDTYDYSCW